MTSLPTDLSFLQQLYGQDTLYFIPDEEVLEAVPVTQVANVAPPASSEPVKATPSMPGLPPEPVREPSSQPTPAPAAESAEEIYWLGEALKGTYLLFQVPDEVFQKLPQHLFLQKVLAAVGLSTQQVKFGNLSTALVHDVKQIAASQRANAILLFGQGLPVANLDRMEFYRMYKSGDSRFVLVDSLEDIEKSVDLKKKLWDVLQKIFLQPN